MFIEDRSGKVDGLEVWRYRGSDLNVSLDSYSMHIDSYSFMVCMSELVRRRVDV